MRFTYVTRGPMAPSPPGAVSPSSGDTTSGAVSSRRQATGLQVHRLHFQATSTRATPTRAPSPSPSPVDSTPCASPSPLCISISTVVSISTVSLSVENFGSSRKDAIQKRFPPMDATVEYLHAVDINMESIPATYQEQGQILSYSFRYKEQRALVPHNFSYVGKNPLVLYEMDGTVVPFEGAFNPLRKRRPRPKNDLDKETNKMWKLLLESINSEGIDGTDEEKANWWEKESVMFAGDRPFLPWKGSVVD